MNYVIQLFNDIDLITFDDGSQYDLDEYCSINRVSREDMLKSADEVQDNRTEEPVIGQECADLLEELWGGTEEEAWELYEQDKQDETDLYESQFSDIDLDF